MVEHTGARCCAAAKTVRSSTPCTSRNSPNPLKRGWARSSPPGHSAPPSSLARRRGDCAAFEGK
eukprot:5031146-Prymnesium_polylepis.1